MTIDATELKNLLSNVTIQGFTHYLKGEPQRFVIALTDNATFTFDWLQEQIEYYGSYWDTLTVGWRRSPTWDIYIDIGTATDDRATAKQLGLRYRQAEIRDSILEESIPRVKR